MGCDDRHARPDSQRPQEGSVMSEGPGGVALDGDDDECRHAKLVDHHAAAVARIDRRVAELMQQRGIHERQLDELRASGATFSDPLHTSHDWDHSSGIAWRCVVCKVFEGDPGAELLCGTTPRRTDPRRIFEATDWHGDGGGAK
jgi:hypothetical protein